MIEENLELDDKNSQSRRWVFTINNPFGMDIEDIDITKTDVPVKEDYYSKSVMQDLADTQCFDFKYVQISIKKDEFEKEDFIVLRPFFKDMQSAERYFEGLEHLRYCVFQLEQGENGTKHFQGGVFFNIGKRFRTIKQYIPFGHIEKAKGSNSQVRDYCTKKETRISEPIEIGQFAEERERTDIRDFVQLAQSGVSKSELSRLYPTLYLKERNKIDKVYADTYERFSELCRDVDVTFIYGASGVGKTTMLRRKLGLKNMFIVDNYDNSAFTYYNYQDNLVLDEFASNFKLQTMNRLLDVVPFQMRGLGSVKYASFHHVYIVSNFKLTELYQDIKRVDFRLWQTFNRRIHRIIRVDKDGVEHVERDTEWEDNTNPIDCEQGLTRQIKRVWEIDQYGNKLTLFDRYKNIDLQEVKNIDIPFVEEDKQEEMEF